MGMSIDEAIIALERDIHNARICGYQIDQYKVAIDTMRKYQKIEQILSDWINDDLVGMSDYWMGRIKEVVEDGNDD